MSLVRSVLTCWCSSIRMPPLFLSSGIEIDDEQAEKIFTAKDAVEFIKNNL